MCAMKVPKGKSAEVSPEQEPTVSSVHSAGKYERKILRWEEIQKNTSFPNHRREMTNLKDLSASIEETGLQNAVTVWAVPCEPTTMPWGEVTEQYFLIAGYRRYAAMEQLRINGSKQFDVVPTTIFRGPLLEAKFISLAENVQREDPNPLDLGRVLAQMIDEDNITQTELAQRIGKSRAWVSFVVSLHQGDEKIAKPLIQAVGEGLINHWVAVRIARQPKEEQIEIVRRLRVALKEGKIKAETGKVQEETKTRGKRKIRSVAELREFLESYVRMDKSACDREQMAHISGIMKGIYWSLNNDPDMGEVNPEKWYPGYAEWVESLMS